MNTLFMRLWALNGNGKFLLDATICSLTTASRPSITGLKKHWCPEIVALIEKMWAHEHEQRPTMSEVVTELEDLVKCY